MEKQNICKERVTSPHAMDTTPIENSVLGVGEDDELTTPEDDSYDSSLQLAPLPDPPIPFSGVPDGEEYAELRQIFASIKAEREENLKKELFHTVISRDELREQLPKLFDCVLDNLLKHPSILMPRKDLLHIMISQFAEQGVFDQQLRLILEQAAADWTKEKDKMSSNAADLIFVAQIPKSKFTRFFSSSQAAE